MSQPDPSEFRPARRWIAVVGDLVEGPPDRHDGPYPSRFATDRPEDGPLEPVDLEAERSRTLVTGGYLERLPLACLKAGLVDAVEIWHGWRGDAPPAARRESPVLTRRIFRLDDGRMPARSADMLDFVRAYGPPTILLVLGLGVGADILQACRGSTVVYNSIDAPALRVPPEVSRHVDLVITGAEWQSRAVWERHPDIPCLVLPIGPEFAAPDLFRPLAIPRDYDVVYVAAAQGYKRHDILFDAMAQLPDLRALCVFGYGERADEYREEIRRRALPIDCIGPPGVPHAEVNRLMNRARIGVVCGVDDGAPAILTEYMLAGLPVLANEALTCGLAFIRPDTGRTATEAGFAAGIRDLLARADAMSPRDAVLAEWAWPHSVRRFAAALRTVRFGTIGETDVTSGDSRTLDASPVLPSRGLRP